MRGWKSLPVFLLLVAAAAVLGALSTPDTWYADLAKPSFNPPNALFAPVWTALYALMALAAWRIYRLRGSGNEIAVWIVQLAVNAIWSPLFFGMHWIGIALVDIVLLDVLVAVTLVLFYRRDRLAGWLLAPYLAWIIFASVLNAALWHLNPG
jgi:tryptophan-rich sensory protein